MSIKIENLSHIYATGTPLEKVALDDINLEIPQGQFLGVAGHTGSGKSTLVQHLNGLLKATKGRVIVDGLDLSNRKTDLREIRKRVGLAFQYPEHQLFAETVFEDIAFGPTNMGMEKEQITKVVAEAMNFVGLDYHSFKDSNPFQLSGGQRRRVALAGVLVLQPKVLVLDEPTAGLDPKGREEIFSLIRELNRKKGTTIVLVSHSMEDLSRLVDTLIVLNKGKIVISGTPKEVFIKKQELESYGLGLPLITELMMELKARGLPVKEDIITLLEAVMELKKVLRGSERKC